MKLEKLQPRMMKRVVDQARSNGGLATFNGVTVSVFESEAGTRTDRGSRHHFRHCVGSGRIDRDVYLELRTKNRGHLQEHARRYS